MDIPETYLLSVPTTDRNARFQSALESFGNAKPECASKWAADQSRVAALEVPL
jgi:hypothetical protein